jgi:hypothetical protein
MIETIIVGIIVAVAILFIVRSIFRTLQGKKRCGCSAQCSCGSEDTSSCGHLHVQDSKPNMDKPEQKS